MSTKPNIVMDWKNLGPETLKRNGENPNFCVIAVHPDPDELIEPTLIQLRAELLKFMNDDEIVIIEREVLLLDNGQDIEMFEASLVFSLAYPTQPSRVYELTLRAPKNVTLH